MECPHCQQELASAACPDCGRPALPGADFCHSCGHQLPPAPQEGAKLLTCSSCGKPAPEGSDYCPSCGHAHAEGEHDHGELPATCPGCEAAVLPRHAYCPECGLALAPEDGEATGGHLEAAHCPDCGGAVLPRHKYCPECGIALPPMEDEEPAPQPFECSDCGARVLPRYKYCPECGAATAPVEEGGDEAEGEAPAPGKRVACSDGNCIGIIGPDGKCTECGKPYQPGGED